MAFTEFCCRSGGSNMNGGRIASNGEPATTPVYSATNGGWNSATGVFTPTSGDPSLTVTVGDWAHVFTDGSTTPTRIAQVTARNSTTITLSTSVGVGTAPTTAGTGISINVGGAWAGMSAGVSFPVSFVSGGMVSNSMDRVRVNFKNDQTYNVTAALTPTGGQNLKYQGYTTSFGDGGRATIDGGTSGASYIVWNDTAIMMAVEDFIFQNNGATGSEPLIKTSTVGNAQIFLRHVTLKNARGDGVFFANGGGNQSIAVECEAYNCNQSNTANMGGFNTSTGASFIRCYSHGHTTGSNCHGFVVAGGPATIIGCVADSNSGAGFKATTESVRLINCDSYNNALDGIAFASGGGNAIAIVENCNFVKNGGYGINGVQGGSGSSLCLLISNCGFGSGTQANTSGATNLPATSVVDLFEISGSVTYPTNTTPWVDPANGDFRINLAQAKNAGRGTFLQTQNSKAGTIGYPDIGAAQHQDAGGGGTGISRARGASGF